jgi:capsular polysaccharide biosynthesis protein
MNERLDLQRITSAILRRWIVVLAVTVGIAMLGNAASKATAATYEATTSVLVGQEPPGVIIENSDRATKEQLALTFAELAVRAPVLEPAAAALGMDSWRPLRSRVAIELAPRTLLLDLHVTGTSPEDATRAADEVADQLVAVSEDLSPYRQVKVGPARADTEPIGPNVQMNTLFAAIIGFVVASALALVLELVRERKKRSFRSSEDIPFLGTVRARRASGPASTPDSAAIEEGAVILGNLRVACRPNPVRTIVVTGASMAERSRVATQLAATLSHGEVPAALVDLGLRDPVIHRIFGIPRDPGVSDLLEHRGPRRGLLHGVNEYLQVLPAGRPTVNPSLLLTPEAVDKIVKHVGSFADVVVFDVPLTDRIAELGLVAERVDAIVLVIRNRLTRTEERRVGEDLTALGVQPSGVVVVRTSFFSRFFRRVPPPPGLQTHTNEAHAALLTVDAEPAPARRARADREHDATGARRRGSATSSRSTGNGSGSGADPDLDAAFDSDRDTGPRAEAAYGAIDADPTHDSGGAPRSRRAPAKKRSRKASDGPQLTSDAPATNNNGHEPGPPRDAVNRIDADDAIDMADPLNGFDYRAESSDLDRRGDI